MQTAFNFLDIVRPVKQATSQNSFVITSRDLEIISFISEMKFASLDDLYQKFFKVLKSGEESKSQWWAKERITKLVKHNFLMRVYSFSEKTSYYLATPKAYLTVLKSCPDNLPVRPLTKIDQNTFKHDKYLVKTRLAFESKGMIKSWISDRQLFQYPEVCMKFGEGNQPDAIYTNQKSERVALELEISRKSKRRYTDKVRNYIHMIRQYKANPLGFSRAHYVVANETIKNLILDEVKVYQEYFTVQLLSEVLPSLNLSEKGEL